jgi:hypothetical protein
VKSVAVYTAGRFLIFAALVGLLALAGLRGFLLLAAALLLSMPASYFLLARQRAALAENVERSLTDRRTRKDELRAQLRGDDGA